MYTFSMRWNDDVLPCGIYRFLWSEKKHVIVRRWVVGRFFEGGNWRFKCLVCFKPLLIFQNAAESHEETSISSPIAFEISSNASKFAAFSAIRSLVLEHETKFSANSKVKSIDHQARIKGDEETSDAKIIDALHKLEIEKFNVPYVS